MIFQSEAADMKLPTSNDEFLPVADQFTVWVEKVGGKVMDPTSEWEVMRYQTTEPQEDGTVKVITSVIYKNGKNKLSYTGYAARHLSLCSDGHDAGDYLADAGQAMIKIKRRPSKIQVDHLTERDGQACFFCGEFFDEDRPPTREHLGPVMEGGTDHMANLVLAHPRCNQIAGKMCIHDKVLLREKFKEFRQNMKLAAWDSITMNAFETWLAKVTYWTYVRAQDPPSKALLLAERKPAVQEDVKKA
jgi:hypothetical protein